MKAQKISHHIAFDRMDRAIAILERVGLGEEMLTVNWVDSTGRPCLRTLTTTGIILCKNVQTLTVTTMFVATAQQVRQMYGTSYCPSFIYGVVKKNQVRFKDIL